MDYALLLKTAYRVTKHYSRLWWLGLFLASGFTFSLLHFPGLPAGGNPMRPRFPWEAAADYSSGSILILLVLFLIGLVLTNWTKVLLVLNLQAIFKVRRVTDLKKGLEATRDLGDRRLGEGDLVSDEFENPVPPLESMFSQSKAYLGRVIVISLFTTVVMVMGLSVLSIPFLSFAKNPEAQSFVGACAGFIFIFLAIVISLVSVFGSFFAILFAESAGTAINLATDLLVSRWRVILAAASMFASVYAVAFFAGWYVLGAIEAIFMNTAQISAPGLPTAHLANILHSMVLWMWLAVLNIFFYSGLFALFIFLVRPTMTDEAAALAPQVTGVSVP